MSKSYNPGRLLDILIEKLRLKNDAALSRALDITPAHISKFRTGSMLIGATALVRMSEEVNLPVGDLREMMGLPRRMYIGA